MKPKSFVSIFLQIYHSSLLERHASKHIIQASRSCKKLSWEQFTNLYSALTFLWSINVHLCKLIKRGYTGYILAMGGQQQKNKGNKAIKNLPALQIQKELKQNEKYNQLRGALSQKRQHAPEEIELRKKDLNLEKEKTASSRTILTS